VKIELKVAVEMTDEQVCAWAESVGLDVAAVEKDVAKYLRAILKEDTASPYWNTEVN
jgi:hypothetical protein